MIIAMIGGIGSGKTLSCVREICRSNNYPLTNFKLKKIKHHRMMYSDIILNKKSDDGKKTLKDVNWPFWNDLRDKNPNFSIYLDEAHNIIGSRNSMSKENQLLSRWISQIRKILSDSTQNHIYIVTQKPRRIDINFRELTHVLIACKKIQVKDRTYIINSYYEGFDEYDMGMRKGKEVFLANPYFKYYDTNEMIEFGAGEQYV